MDFLSDSLALAPLAGPGLGDAQRQQEPPRLGIELYNHLGQLHGSPRVAERSVRTVGQEPRQRVHVTQPCARSRRVGPNSCCDWRKSPVASGALPVS